MLALLDEQPASGARDQASSQPELLANAYTNNGQDAVTRYHYHTKWDLADRTAPGNVAETFEYDLDGRLQHRVKADFVAQVHNDIYRRDAQGRVVELTAPVAADYANHIVNNYNSLGAPSACRTPGTTATRASSCSTSTPIEGVALMHTLEVTSPPGHSAIPRVKVESAARDSALNCRSTQRRRHHATASTARAQ